jgi:hypothetical protein
LQKTEPQPGAMTLLNVVLAVFPINDVPNPVAFAAKIGGTVLGLNVAGDSVLLESE